VSEVCCIGKCPLIWIHKALTTLSHETVRSFSHRLLHISHYALHTLTERKLFLCVKQKLSISRFNAIIIDCYSNLKRYKIITKSRDSIVGIATGYGLDNRGVGSSNPGRVKNFLFSMSSRPALGPTQHPIQWVPGVKWPGCEADHSS
jgi:hypothetical protein